MSATDPLTITSALDALTRYYYAKDREESAVLYINDAYLEVLNLLENLEAENAKLRELATMLHRCARGMLRDLAPSCVDRSKEGCGMDCTDNGERCCMKLLERRMRELGVDV